MWPFRKRRPTDREIHNGIVACAAAMRERGLTQEAENLVGALCGMTGSEVRDNLAVVLRSLIESENGALREFRAPLQRLKELLGL